MSSLGAGTAEDPAVVTLSTYDAGVVLLGLGLLVALSAANLVIAMGRG